MLAKDIEIQTLSEEDFDWKRSIYEDVSELLSGNTLILHINNSITTSYYCENISHNTIANLFITSTVLNKIVIYYILKKEDAFGHMSHGPDKSYARTYDENIIDLSTLLHFLGVHI